MTLTNSDVEIADGEPQFMALLHTLHLSPDTCERSVEYQTRLPNLTTKNLTYKQALIGVKMQPLDPSLRSSLRNTTVVTTSQIDLSDHSDSVKTETGLPQQEKQQASTFPVEEVLPVRLVTWNVEEKTSEEEETLSRLGRRKLKAMKKKAFAEKKKEEDNSWKLWFWSQGCPCWFWSPMYIFKDIEDTDQSTMATSKCDQSSMATSTFYTRDEDDDSSIPSCSRIGSTLDHTNSIDDEHISDVSSNSSDGSLNSEMNDKPTDVEQTAQPSQTEQAEVYIVKDWSREGLSKNTIMDMDVYMAAMRD